MLLKCQNFWKVGAADEEIFQESPLHEETSTAQDHEEYNSPTNKRKCSDFEGDDTYSNRADGRI